MMNKHVSHLAVVRRIYSIPPINWLHCADRNANCEVTEWARRAVSPTCW